MLDPSTKAMRDIEGEATKAAAWEILRLKLLEDFPDGAVNAPVAAEGEVANMAVNTAAPVDVVAYMEALDRLYSQTVCVTPPAADPMMRPVMEEYEAFKKEPGLLLMLCSAMHIQVCLGVSTEKSITGGVASDSNIRVSPKLPGSCVFTHM